MDVDTSLEGIFEEKKFEEEGEPPHISPVVKKLLLLISIVFTVVIAVLSFRREEYIRKIVHIKCNQRIPGFFNKTLVDGGYKCTRNGEVLEFIPMTPSIIPSPVKLLLIYTAVAGAVTGVFYLSRRREVFKA